MNLGDKMYKKLASLGLVSLLTLTSCGLRKETVEYEGELKCGGYYVIYKRDIKRDSDERRVVIFDKNGSVDANILIRSHLGAEIINKEGDLIQINNDGVYIISKPQK